MIPCQGRQADQGRRPDYPLRKQKAWTPQNKAGMTKPGRI
jgi:hypothetical protein